MDIQFDKSNGKNHAEGTVYDVLIIGGGPAGATAAIYASRAGLSTLVIDKGLTAGALGITNKIANYPGILGEIGGAELLDIMRQQAQSFGATFVSDKVIGVDLLSEEKSVFANGGTYTGRAVIIATGSMGRGKRVKGEDELLGKGVSYCATCDGAFFRDQEVAVVGNSDEAIEEGLFLTRFVDRVHFISPTPELKAPAHLVEELSGHPKVTLYPGAALREVVGTDQVEGVLFAPRGEPERMLPVTGAFIYLQGGKPVTDYLVGQLELSETGYIPIDAEFQTSIPRVYAVGDLVQGHIKQAVVAAADGAVAGMAVEKVLRGRKQIVADWSK